MEPLAKATISEIKVPVAKLEIASVADELFLTEIFLITVSNIETRLDAVGSNPLAVKTLSVKLFIKDDVSMCSEISWIPES